MEKIQYEEAVVEIIEFEAEDVIVTSGDPWEMPIISG